jgi:hypothetical protein
MSYVMHGLTLSILCAWSLKSRQDTLLARILPRDAAAAATLRTRTLTNLYNERPQWLADAHRDLDAAVAEAYGWPTDISEEAVLGKLLELNLSRAAAVGLPADEEALEPSPD